ncbi:antirestriction protein [Klebsiella pneumoniae]|uniref:antirestriction protein n=1 Tax=Klebsiella pneumoniae TaxID=573 RepID=UPI003A5CB077
MPGYEGGFWHFIRLPEGRLHDAGLWPVHLVSSENWFDRMQRRRGGHYSDQPAINRRLAAHHDSSNPALTRLYMRDAQLWNHITFHPECSAIYAALD